MKTSLVSADGERKVATVCSWHHEYNRGIVTPERLTESLKALGYEVTHTICKECRQRMKEVFNL